MQPVIPSIANGWRGRLFERRRIVPWEQSITGMSLGIPSADDFRREARMEERRRASWISGSVLVRGDVVSTEDLVIDGQVQGTIDLGDHALTIGPSASVVADLDAKVVTISGKLIGSVLASARVELKATASVEGDVTSPQFVMEEGATLKGKVDTGSRR